MNTWQAVEAFINAQKAKGLSLDTIRWYSGILNLFAQRYVEIPLLPEGIESFIASCKGKDERRHGYYRTMRVFFNFLHKRYRLQNPMEYIDAPRRKPKKPKPLTTDELDQLLAFPHKPKVKTGLLFLADTGARVGEAANLALRDLNETPFGFVTRVSGKTGDRIVPISTETYQALIKYLPFGYSPYRFRRIISRAFKDAMVRGSGINLRHTFATLWLGDELILQQIMGHSHLSTTRIYRALRTELVSAQHHQYSPLRMVFSRSRSML
ncbi:MAG: tyrosine-type recombinase/integrase [Proteobacteria bacterium]|nr:tyrosine-type recombinase/integrase [Pseudomonadota bacterium]